MQINIMRKVETAQQAGRIRIMGLIAAALMGISLVVTWPFDSLKAKDNSSQAVEELNRRLEQSHAKLLPEPRPVSAKITLEEALLNIASEAGVELANRRPEREERLNYDYLKVSMRVDQILCQPDQAMNFLNRIKTFDKYHLMIDQVDIQPASYRPADPNQPKDNRIRLGATIAAIIRALPEQKEEQARSAKVAAQQEDIAALEEKVKFIEGIVSQPDEMPDVWQDLTTRLSDSTSIRSFRYQGCEVRVNLFSSVRSTALIPKLEQSPFVKEIEPVGQTYKDTATGKEVVTLKAKLKSNKCK